jgi:hypothetical protein
MQKVTFNSWTLVRSLFRSATRYPESGKVPALSIHGRNRKGPLPKLIGTAAHQVRWREAGIGTKRDPIQNQATAIFKIRPPGVEQASTQIPGLMIGGSIRAIEAEEPDTGKGLR